MAKDWEYVAGMEPMILVSLHYDKTKQNLVLAIIKVANLKALPNDKMPGTIQFSTNVQYIV